jgi:hypothetical protein
MHRRIDIYDLQTLLFPEPTKGQGQMSEDEDLEDLFQAIEGVGSKVG